MRKKDDRAPRPTSNFYAKKIQKYFAINVLLKAGEPTDVEFLGTNPADPAELRAFGGGADLRLGSQEIDKKIGLLLAMITLFGPALIKQIAIRSFRIDDPIVTWLERHFFLQFANKGLCARLRFLDASLRKLPTARNVKPFSDENAPIIFPNDSCNIWPISRRLHGRCSSMLMF